MFDCKQQLVEQYWMMGKKEIGSPATPFTKKNLEMIHFLSTFTPQVNYYQFLSGSKQDHNVSLFYATIWKSGSQGINLNLLGLHRRKKKHGAKNPGFNNQQQVTEFQFSGIEPQYRKENPSFMEIFTFIRDPLSHFTSAMAETFLRTKDAKKYGIKQNYTVEDINSFPMEVYLRTLIEAIQPRHQFAPHRNKSIPVMFQFQHLAHVSNTFFVFNITDVMHLENFKEDWEYIRRKYGISEEFNYKLGQHPESSVSHPLLAQEKKSTAIASSVDDGLRVHSRLNEVFKTQPEYLRGVCRILLIDYVCFPEYALPVECQPDMNETVARGREYLRECTTKK